MKNNNIILLQFYIIFHILNEILSYNDSVPFNFTQTPRFCYFEDFELNDYYRPFEKDRYPIRGCSSDERNSLNQGNYTLLGFRPKITNITYEPRLDYFFNKDVYPPQNRDPLNVMTFKIINIGQHFKNQQNETKFTEVIHFGRSDDYHSIPKISKKTGKPIQFSENWAVLNAKIKIVNLQLDLKKEYDFSYSDYEINDYEGINITVLFNGYLLDFTGYVSFFKNFKFIQMAKYALLLKVYDLPRMKVQGLFQYKYAIYNIVTGVYSNGEVYTVDTRNVFFQNISMFYNQKVNVTDEGLEPTGEDSGFWVNTPCNRIQMATIMVDYHFFDTIHRMQSYGYEFGDRFQLRIHTPYYRKTLNSEYSLFRSQWNTTYPEPRVFIHPISKYKEHCDKYKNCTKFDYEKWSTDPEFTQYIRDVNCKIVKNQIWINFTELEEIYKADGFHRGKLVINVNNTMTPHITQITNGLWAELVDLVTNDWVMKTKTIMDEVHGYIDDYEPDPYRNFYLTCEIPDNITGDDVELYIKKFAILRTAHLWFKLDVFNQGITKLYPPRINTVFKFPPEILVTNKTFMLTYMYYKKYNNIDDHWYWVLKDLELDGIGDGTITNGTFDVKRNLINVSELHSNMPNGDDTCFWTQAYEYLCVVVTGKCQYVQFRRQFLYYFFDLHTMYSKNNTGPVDITVYYVKYVPYHSKNQINRGLHRWNQHHAGWYVPPSALFYDKRFKDYTYNFYYEAWEDNFYYRNPGDCCYYNLYGSTNFNAYNGPDCVFGIAGGSTMRNRSCEYWVGLIPDQPFTNYARDIYEEYIAYRTINDNTFSFNTSIITEPYKADLFLTCGVPGRKTAIILRLGLIFGKDDRWYVDGDLLCTQFSHSVPTDCPRFIEKSIETFPMIVNVNKYTQEYFTRIDLPENLIVHDNFVGQVRPCLKENYTRFYDKNYTYPFHSGNALSYDHWCYYANSSTFYVFNTLDTIGQWNKYLDFDVQFYADGFYYLENSPPFDYNSFHINFGFYEDYFYQASLPKKNNSNFTVSAHEGTRCINISVSKDNFQNDMMSTLNISMIFTKTFYVHELLQFYFVGIRYLYLVNQYYNGQPADEFNFINGRRVGSMKPYTSEIYYNSCPEELYLNYSSPRNFTLMLTTYYQFYNSSSNEKVIEGNEILNFTMHFTILNSRSLKPVDVYGFVSDFHFTCLYETLYVNFTNKIPKYFSNLTVTPNSYFTSDRSIYKFKFYANLSSIFIGDIFEFKTSWKTKYYDNIEDPDENGYYINRFIINKNETQVSYWTFLANFLLNPETLETQYIKDIRFLDNDGYLIALCNETVSIKMQKVAEFKRTEVHTEKTDDDNKFNIRFEAVPEILIKKNDTLNIKFSSIVSLKDYPECKIESSKGLNIESSDFKCEINGEKNEIILYNAFKDIGENISIFDNISALALNDQQFIFLLKDVPIYSNTNDLENVYSIELKTETNGKETQKNLLASTAIFKCDSRCKTCNEQAPSECLSCNDKYPIYYPNEKYCHKFCPKEKYIQKEKENGNIECIICEEPCENCLGYATNCTLCSDGYFMENNKCVKNCTEGNEKDYILRICYPKILVNKTVFVEREVYVNVSVPDPNIIIERNICMINQN